MANEAQHEDRGKARDEAPGSPRDDRPRAPDDLQRLREQKERAELRAHIAALTTPWWRKASLVATVTAILAAVLPITTMIQEHYRNEREYALQQTKQQAELAMQRDRQQNEITLQQGKQEHDIRIAYLDRFDVPGRRLQTLRFLIATSTDPRLLAWARDEQKIVQDQLARIEQELAAVTEKIAKSPPGQVPEDLKKQRDELNRLKDVTTLRPQTGSGSGSR